jgi:DNA-binding MarR family transcriptional regulator
MCPSYRSTMETVSCYDGMVKTLRDDDFQRLLEFRDGLRRFLRWSEDRAKAVGLTTAQHQLLLAVRGHRGDGAPTIGAVAAHLLLRHHSAVELVDRAQHAGLLERSVDPLDHRVVRLHLTAEGERCLAALTAQHLEEIRRLEPQLRPIWDGLASHDDSPTSFVGAVSEPA